MDATSASEHTPKKNETIVTRASDRELVTTRTFNGPARIVFKAWTTPELMKRWWTPKSSGAEMLSCEMDVRVGGGYRLEFKHPCAPQPMAFFGKYTEVVPNTRLVWTNEEGDAGIQITTVTFDEKGGKTHLTIHEMHPSKEALDAAMAGGAESGSCESYDQLDELLATIAK